jgi:hypothetical protein
MTYIHQRIGDGPCIVPARPRLEEADHHVDIFMNWMRSWAEGCDLANRKEEPDRFLDNVNEHMRLSKYDEIFMGYVNGEMTYDELMRRILESGG